MGSEYFRQNNAGGSPAPRPPPSPSPKKGGARATANFRPHDSVARRTEHYPSQPWPVGPGEYQGVPEFGQAPSRNRKRAEHPFDAGAERATLFDDTEAKANPTPGPGEYQPQEADSLTMLAAPAKTISTGPPQVINTEYLQRDPASLGPGTYEQKEGAPAGGGFSSNFVGGTGRAAPAPAELAVRTGCVPHPDAQPTPGPTTYDVDDRAQHPRSVTHDMSHKSYPSQTLDHLHYDSRRLGPGTYEPGHRLTESCAPSTSLSTREELNSDTRLRHWLPRDSLAASRGPADYEPPPSDFDLAAAGADATDLPNSGAARNTCAAAFSDHQSRSAAPENIVPGGRRYDSAMGGGWRPSVPWTVGPGSYPPYDPELEAALSAAPEAPSSARRRGKTQQVQGATEMDTQLQGARVFVFDSLLNDSTSEDEAPAELDEASRGFGATEQHTVPFNFTGKHKKFYEKQLSVGAKPVPGPGEYTLHNHNTFGHSHRKQREKPTTFQTGSAHSFPKARGPEALHKGTAGVPTARSVSSGLTSLVQVAKGHKATSGGTSQAVGMEHLYRDETLIGPGSYQPDRGPNDPATDTGADKGPEKLRKKASANFTSSVEGVYTRTSASGFLSARQVAGEGGAATGSPGGPPLRERRAVARWGDWDVRVGGPWQWHDDEGSKRARAREPRVPGPGFYDVQQYEALRPRVRDSLILPEKGNAPSYSTAATTATDSVARHSSARLACTRQLMAAEREHVRELSGARTPEPPKFDAPQCSPSRGIEHTNRHRHVPTPPPPPPKPPTPEAELAPAERLLRRENASMRKMQSGNFKAAGNTAREALEKLEQELASGTQERYTPTPPPRDDASPSSEVQEDPPADEAAAEPETEPEPEPEQEPASTKEEHMVQLFLVMLQSAYRRHQHDEVFRLLAEGEERWPGNSRLAAFAESFQSAILAVISPPVSEVSEAEGKQARRTPPRKVAARRAPSDGRVRSSR